MISFRRDNRLVVIVLLAQFLCVATAQAQLGDQSTQRDTKNARPGGKGNQPPDKEGMGDTDRQGGMVGGQNSMGMGGMT